METWKDIKGYSGWYQISNLGKVRSWKKPGYFGAGIKREKPKILYQFKHHTGYYVVGLGRNGQKKQHFIHRLIAKYFIPNPENKSEVNHKNGIKIDNRIENLEWVTHAENIIHAGKNGLMAHGENHYKAKLSRKEVATIRNIYATTDITQRELEEKFNIGESTIGKIINRKIWKKI